ncbi:malate synthase A [Glutamicibacter protophormiae]|uniref:Malate synthase n=1 Tax=Glutamicibacter protophormiae TaxID=37930 RepID=A0ABS4XP47_GLUPR|nr:malate synthase A [Glutamicibacter protophormiae]MBP2398284.1 malate synthase [Glutamicibacter protophormiae]GGL89958.1 malate synthase [Glutamicibacter protophormiae]
MNTPITLNNITITATEVRYQEQILTSEALDFLSALHQGFENRRTELMQSRQLNRARIANGRDPKFLEETRNIREDASWQVAPIAPGLEDRRVEITGPIERKAAINALNSGANVWLADMEDACSPTWQNVIKNQVNLIRVLDNELDFTAPDGREYKLDTHDLKQLPTIVVRPRALHQPEKHLRVNGAPMSASLVDFGLHFFHNAKRLMAAGRGPYYYLPKLENHLEARLWNDVFNMAQDMMGIDRGTIRATVHIECITAAFEMEEILYELREHSSGLNAGRWDYIFSIIKNFRSRGPRFVFPDRDSVTMTAPFMRAYTEQLVRACHRRGATAIGGMSTFVPSRKDASINEINLAKVREDKAREAADGFDGSWVAHPDLVAVAREVYTEVLGDNPNQIGRTREDVQVSATALLDVAGLEGKITEQGIRDNIEIGIRYIESWLRGNGAVVLRNLMEDSATAEISRSQLWQWIHQSAITDQGEIITRRWVQELAEETMDRMERFEGDRFESAMEIFEACALRDDFPTFMTRNAYLRYLDMPVPVLEMAG